MNRILRRWFPKGTNFDQVTEAEVAQAAEWMNNYPRRILGWRSAGAVFEEYVAALKSEQRERDGRGQVLAAGGFSRPGGGERGRKRPLHRSGADPVYHTSKIFLDFL